MSSLIELNLKDPRLFNVRISRTFSSQRTALDRSQNMLLEKNAK